MVVQVALPINIALGAIYCSRLVVMMTLRWVILGVALRLRMVNGSSGTVGNGSYTAFNFLCNAILAIYTNKFTHSSTVLNLAYVELINTGMTMKCVYWIELFRMEFYGIFPPILQEIVYGTKSSL